MERKVKGIWIPIEVWQASDLSWNEKILLMEIDSFTSRDEDCFFSNEYISELLGVSVYTASRFMKHLEECGYITTRFDGRRRFAQSRLAENRKAALRKTAKQTCQKEQDNNINIINTSNKVSTNVDNKLPKFDFLRSLIDMGVAESTARDWMAVRKNKKATNTETAFKAIVKEIAASGMDPDTAVQIAVVSEWRGIKAEWLKNYVAKNTEPEESVYERIARGEAEIERMRAEGLI